MMRTLAGSAVKNARSMFNFAEKHKPLKNIPLDLEDIGHRAYIYYQISLEE